MYAVLVNSVPRISDLRAATARADRHCVALRVPARSQAKTTGAGQWPPAPTSSRACGQRRAMAVTTGAAAKNEQRDRPRRSAPRGGFAVRRLRGMPAWMLVARERRNRRPLLWPCFAAATAGPRCQRMKGESQKGHTQHNGRACVGSNRARWMWCNCTRGSPVLLHGRWCAASWP
ncbi:hypothetical protein MRX96_040811 [Rhipicephalus microplus]